MIANANGVCGCGVGDGHHGQTYQSDPKNAPNESASASRRMISPSLSLCPWKSEIDSMRTALNDPIYGIDSNGGGGLRSDEASNCLSDRCRMNLYA